MPETNATLVTSATEEQLAPDVREAVEAARELLAPRYAGFNLEPEIYLVDFVHPGGELSCVLLPIQQAQMEEVARRSRSAPDKAPDHILSQVLFWVRGQQEEGQRGAMKYLRQLAQLAGGTLAVAPAKIADAYTTALDQGGTATAKKL